MAEPQPAAQPSNPKTVANQQNAQKSTGPLNTISTRYNAVKHGFLAEGITELDDHDGFIQLNQRLKAEYKPVGEMEVFFVNRIALLMVRLKRAALMEADQLTALLNPPDIGPKKQIESRLEKPIGKFGMYPPVFDPGIPARLSAEDMDGLCNKFIRYESAIENKLYRALNQLERLQRMRGGELIPAPVTLDVGLRSDA
ncbi:MAG: hypothetical protein WCG79_03225 [Verrucomicrobiota bacterium]|jgi:hypothetical protein